MDFINWLETKSECNDEMGARASRLLPLLENEKGCKPFEAYLLPVFNAYSMYAEEFNGWLEYFKPLHDEYEARQCPTAKTANQVQQ